MNFLEKLDYMMEKMSINKSKLSQISGVPYTTIDGFYKKGYENTKISTVRKIASALNVSLDYLVDDNISDERYKPPRAKKSPSDLSEEAKKVAKDYDSIDKFGQRTVRAVIDIEKERCSGPATGSVEMQHGKIIPLFLSPPAAGIASPILGEDYDEYELKKDDPQNAMYAVKVGGNSMEPYFPDGSIAFCTKAPIENGDIGVFSIDGSSVIKQYYRDALGFVYLFSLNRARSDADVILTQTSGQTLACLGKVITKQRFPLPK